MLQFPHPLQTSIHRRRTNCLRTTAKPRPQHLSTTKKSSTHALIARRLPSPTCTPSHPQPPPPTRRVFLTRHTRHPQPHALGRPVQPRHLHAGGRRTLLIPPKCPQGRQRRTSGHVLFRAAPLAAERERWARRSVEAAVRGGVGDVVYPPRGLGSLRIEWGWLWAGRLAHVGGGCTCSLMTLHGEFFWVQLITADIGSVQIVLVGWGGVLLSEIRRWVSSSSPNVVVALHPLGGTGRTFAARPTLCSTALCWCGCSSSCRN